MVAVPLLSRLCEGVLSRTQQARYAVVVVFVIICSACWVMPTADRCHSKVSYQVPVGSGDM